MSIYRLTASATDDLAELLLYVEEHFGWGKALATEERLFALFARLAEFPKIGHTRRDLTNRPVLFFPERPYLVIYDPSASQLLVHAILHASRDVQSILLNRPY